jgi:WD40 repeat protein
MPVPAAALAAILLLSGTDPAHASFPGGFNGQIAFSGDGDRTGNTQIFVMGPGGQSPTNIVNNDDNYSHPAFSADGSKIVLSGDPDIGNDELYVMDADGQNRQRLTKTEADETQPAFSPDGSLIAFVRFVDGSAGDELWLMRSDGTGAHRITQPPADPSSFGAEGSPTFSPDGTRIAFDRFIEGNADVYTIGPAGGSAQRLTTNPAHDSQPSYSPDGQRIAFTSDRDGNDEIYLMDADGSGQTRLTNDPASDTAPAFSPDGQKIAFQRNFGDLVTGGPGTDPNAEDTAPWPQAEILVVDAAGGTPVNLTKTPEDVETEPDWQPLAVGADRTRPAFRGAISVTAPSPTIARAGRTLTIGYRLSEAASAKLAVERVAPGIRLKRRGIRRCVRSTARNRSTAERQIRRRLGARARGPAGARRVRRALRGARCTFATLERWLVHRSRRGRNRVRVSDRAGGLSAGRYRIRAGAVDATANPARQKLSRVFSRP